MTTERRTGLDRRELPPTGYDILREYDRSVRTGVLVALAMGVGFLAGLNLTAL